MARELTSKNGRIDDKDDEDELLANLFTKFAQPTEVDEDDDE